MTSSEFKNIIDDILTRILENNNLSYFENILNTLQKYLAINSEKIKEKEDDEIIKYEKRTINDLYNIIKMYISNRNLKLGLNNLNNIETNKIMEITEKKYVGIVLRDIPKFRGSDKRLYGPFKRGDIILINNKDYNRLKSKKLIKEEEFQI